ncbi:hypothetical protein KKH3_29460 [Pectobacterium actinidiae]|nr:hypothetical protein KKH3_29460 [Pectobacterium actinidiae]
MAAFIRLPFTECFVEVMFSVLPIKKYTLVSELINQEVFNFVTE